MKKKPLLLATLLSVSALALAPAHAENLVEAAEKAEKANALSVERKNALEEIDARIALLEQRLEAATESSDREAAKARLAELKDRRKELHREYVGARYAELKADIEREYERVAGWASQKAEDLKDRVKSNEPDLTAKTSAALNLNAASAQANLALYQLAPSPTQKDAVRAALKELDKEIDRLEERADEMPKGDARSALQRRIKALESRYKEMRRDFTEARWKAAVEEVKAMWAEKFE